MSRGYKKTRSTSRREQASITGNFLSFLSGLSIGLLVAFFVFLRYQLLEADAADNLAGPASAEESQVQTGKQQPEVKFTFYDTLRNKKVNISEWIAGENDNREDKASDEKINEIQELGEGREGDGNREQYAHQSRKMKDDVFRYVLQVGSFKDFSAADQIKAELALLGIFANIQRIMLNGQDVRHRVRLGPYTSIDEMKDIRQRLQDNDMEFMLLELRAGEDAT